MTGAAGVAVERTAPSLITGRALVATIALRHLVHPDTGPRADTPAAHTTTTTPAHT